MPFAYSAYLYLSPAARCRRWLLAGAGPQAGPPSILEAHPQVVQFFCKRVPAFYGLCSRFRRGLDCLGALVRSRFDQSELVSGICLRPFEGGDKFSMGNG